MDCQSLQGPTLDAVSLLSSEYDRLLSMATLVDELVPDQLWAMVEPLLPVPPRPPYGGRRRAIPDRNCFAAVITWPAP